MRGIGVNKYMRDVAVFPFIMLVIVGLVAPSDAYADALNERTASEGCRKSGGRPSVQSVDGCRYVVCKLKGKSSDWIHLVHRPPGKECDRGVVK